MASPEECFARWSTRETNVSNAQWHWTLRSAIGATVFAIADNL
jgi:hypothetical protein